MFSCAACKAKALAIVLAVDVEPDADSDEASAQILRCSACGAGALGIYEESRRGSLDRESWRHRGWLVGDDVIAAAEARLRAASPPTAEAFRDLARSGKPFDLS